MELTFEALSAANAVRANEWHEGYPWTDNWSLADWSNAMCGEAGETANVVKKIRRIETGHPGAKDPNAETLYKQLGEELADTLIYLDLVATKAGIDLGEAVRDKFNSVSIREGFPQIL